MIKRKSFTLIELLVVIAIIAILSGIIIAFMGDATKSARDAKRESDISNIYTSILAKGIMEGGYPVLSAAIDPSSIPSSLKTYLETYLSSVPADPTGEVSYFYKSDGANFAVGARSFQRIVLRQVNQLGYFH